MKKLFIVFLICFTAFKSYAAPAESDNMETNNNQQAVDNKTLDNSSVEIQSTDNKSVENKEEKKAKKKSNFNKKKITLDRIEDKKWSLRIGYSYFFPDNKYTSIYANRFKIGGAYDINQYLQVQALLQYSNGEEKYNISGVNTKLTGTIYNLGAIVTGLYPFEMPVGELAPFISAGGVYTFGNIRVTAKEERKENLSGGGILAQAGLQYSFHVFSFRLYGEYLYDFTPVKINFIDSFSGVSAGIEMGVKF